LASIIFSVFLTGPLLNLKFSRTSTQDSIHVHAEQAVNHAHVNKEFVCIQGLRTVPALRRQSQLTVSAFTAIVIALKLSLGDERLMALLFLSQENSHVFS